MGFVEELLQLNDLERLRGNEAFQLHSQPCDKSKSQLASCGGWNRRNCRIKTDIKGERLAVTWNVPDYKESSTSVFTE